MADRKPPSAARRQGGFTLLEVLIAFAILAVALSSLLLAFSTGLRTTERSVTISSATLRAQSLMEEIGRTIPVRRGRSSGVLEDGSRWEIAIEPYDTGETGAAAVVRSLFAYSVAVTVEWDGGGAVSLTSLRLAPDDD